jgi:arylsulfatase A-like enzyme
MTGRWQYRLAGAADEPLSGRRSTVLGLPPDHPTLPSILRAGGYATALIGKWHLGLLLLWDEKDMPRSTF